MSEAAITAVAEDIGKVLVLELLDTYIRQVSEHLRTHEALSAPVAEGHWRWADMHLDGYSRKSEDELRADRERNAGKAEKSRELLATARETKRRVLAGEL